MKKPISEFSAKRRFTKKASRLKTRKRTREKRTRKPFIYLICEGLKTETLYFKALGDRISNTKIVPLTSQYKTADGLVENALSTIGDRPYDPDTDQIWCLFDCNSNTNASLNRAQQLAESRGYNLAFSNPSFEYWFLLHFVYYGTEIPNNVVLMRLLKKYLPNYSKSKSFFDELLPNQSLATARALKRIHTLEEEGVRIPSRQSNPVTTVVYLIEHLNAISD